MVNIPATVACLHTYSGGRLPWVQSSVVGMGAAGERARPFPTGDE